MLILVGNAQNDLNIFCDYQKFLRETWTNDSARPWTTYSKEKFTRFYEVRVDFMEHRSR